MSELTLEVVKEKLLTNDRWLYRGLVAIYNRQTQDEKSEQSTKHDNGRGFTGADAEIMSSMAQQLIKKGFLDPNRTQYATLTEKQKAWLRSGKSERFPHRITKYARQLMIVASERA